MNSLFICDDAWGIILSYVSNIPKLSLVNKNSYIVCQRLYIARVFYLIDKYISYQNDLNTLFNLLAYKGDWDDFIILWHNMKDQLNMRISLYIESIALEYNRLDILDFMCNKNPQKLESNYVRLYYMWHTKHSHRFKESRKALHNGYVMKAMHSDMRKYISTKSSYNQRYKIYFEEPTEEDMKHNWLNILAITEGQDYQQRESVIAFTDNDLLYQYDNTVYTVYNYIINANVITPAIVQGCINSKGGWLSQKNPIDNMLLKELIRTNGDAKSLALLPYEFDDPYFSSISKNDILQLFNTLDMERKIELATRYPSIKFDLQLDIESFVKKLRQLMNNFKKKSDVQEFICCTAFTAQYVPVKIDTKHPNFIQAIHRKIDEHLNIQKLSKWRNKLLEWKQNIP